MKETKPNFPELYMKQTETDSAYDGTYPRHTTLEK